jgi:CAAX prenyl protease-like protein
MHLLKALETSPLLARSVPFLIFVGLTFLQGQFGESSRYWFYLAKTIVGIWFIWLIRPWIEEMRWKLSWEGLMVGFAVFGIWVGLDNLYPKLGQAGKVWNPHLEFGTGSSLAWLFVVVRILGSTLVVPPLEEVFYRSLFYRYIVNPSFQTVPFRYFQWTPFLLTSAIFGFTHYQWLAGILCGLAYQGLVIWKGRLGDAIMAHATTNLLLGLWVIRQGAWQFW